jgi:hypothetical protein
MFTSYYFWGVISLLLLWVISWSVTGSWNPVAMAKGHGSDLSLSLLQNLLFTAVAVFAYVTVYAARVIAGGPEGLTALPNVPENLVIMMGLSVVTAAASKGITVSYLREGELPARDKSGIASDRDGRTDLTKVQMLIWTLVAVVVYLVTFFHQMAESCPAASVTCAATMPDVDRALLVLMGVSQGGYVAGKLVSRSANVPTIDHVLPNKAKVGDAVAIHGQCLGASPQGNAIILREAATNQEYAVTSASWNDALIQFTVPAIPLKAYQLMVRANGTTTSPSDLEVIA